MEQGTIVSWLVPDGAQVWQGDEIAEIETDKATLPYEAPETGVLRILVPEGSTLALGEPIGLIDDLAPLPGGQSVAPPGTQPATARGARSAQVPPPRHPAEDSATTSFEIQAELHEPPHTLHASTPPPAARDTAWSPAWGPQPTAQPRPHADPSAEDEGETTEFAAIDPASLPGDRPPAAAQQPVAQAAAPQQPVAPSPPQPTAQAAAPQPVAQTPPPSPPQAATAQQPDAQTSPPQAPFIPPPPAPEDRASVLADDGSGGYGPLFGQPDPVAAPAPNDPVAAPAPTAAVSTPWVDTSLTNQPGGDDRRFTPDELIAPQTLPPRPPELQPTASAARVKASPVARRLARELGIDLATLDGTGPEGRVVRADIEAAQAAGAARPPKQAAAVPATASEFTPPVDEARADAPIPAVEPTPEPDPAEELAQAAAEVAEAITVGTVPGSVGAPLSPAEQAEDVPAQASVAAVEADAAVVVLDDLSPAPPQEPETVAAPLAADASQTASEPAAEAAALDPEADPTGDQSAEASAIALQADAAVIVLDDLTPDDDAPGEVDAAATEAPAAAAAEPAAASAAAEPAAAAVPADDDVDAAATMTPTAEAVESDAPQAPAAEHADAPASEEESAVTPPDAPTPTSESRVLIAAQPGGGKGEPTIVELTRQQQTVARRMAESKATIPDFHTVVEVDAEPLLALRAELTSTRPDLAPPSVNDLLVKATAVALRAFPALNGAYRDGRLEQYPRINVGIAVDSDGKLLVPVVHDADNLSVSQIAARTELVIGKARDGSLRPPDIASATFTLSNLGAFGVERFTAVITPGQAGILTAGAIADRPVVRGGEVVAGKTLILTLTTDHRAIYGAQAAAFLTRVQQLLERPSSLLA
jgi:pyruvate dehydrogenase E2 component (dihydrolipoamide acetyltransferase)